MSGLGMSIYCIVIAALHYNSRHEKRVAPQDNPIRILVLLDISFFKNSQIVSTTPACTIYQKEQRQNVQNSQIVSTTPACTIFEEILFLDSQAIVGLLSRVAKQNLPKRATLLPDNHALLLWQEHRAVGNTKRLVEGVDIAEGDVYAVAAE